MSLSILIYPDKRLRQKALPVLDFTPELRATAAAMFATMRQANGIGLAATQVGILQRLVVIDIPPERDEHHHGELVLVNPEITARSEALSVYEEGCLSLPQQYAEVTRPAEIDCRYQDLDGNTHDIHASGLLATCIQHEIDHLDGVLFIDHLSRLKRDRLTQKLAKHLKRLAQEHHD